MRTAAWALRVSCVVLSLAPLIAASPAHDLNSAYDDYAAAFRQSVDGAELWYTSSAPHNGGAGRSLLFVDCGVDGLGATQSFTPFGAGEDSPAAGSLTGVPAFAACRPDLGVFVSNSGGNGGGDNNLYWMHLIEGQWQVSALDVLNSPYWDDTPALSPNADLIIFASDRRYRHANRAQRRADLYFARRSKDGWEAPEILATLSTDDASQECPFIASDGYLYYASDASGDYDIWRAALAADGLPAGPGLPLRGGEFAGVNRVGSDQTHPLTTPGAAFFMWSSDHGDTSRRDMDLYYLPVQENAARLDLNVRVRRPNRTPEVYGTPLTVNVTDIHNAASETLATDDGGNCRITAPAAAPTPYFDPRLRTIMLRVSPPARNFVAFTDTLVIDAACSRIPEHTMFLWDTTSFIESACSEEFPIYDVRFFITGYWCPTTYAYQKYAPCNSLFFDSLSCLAPPCASNDLYDYSVRARPANPYCIDYNEFHRNGPAFAREVDSAVVLLTTAMQSVFDRHCVDRALAQGRQILVEIIGFTDPRQLYEDCIYTGPTINFTSSFVQVTAARAEDRLKSRDFFVNGQKFRSAGYGGRYGGNQLLSDLRAFYTARMLDGLWRDIIPRYAEIRDQGQLLVEAYGEGVSREATTDPRKRSIRVRVSIPGAEATRHEVHPLVDGGRRLILCDDCGE